MKSVQVSLNTINKVKSFVEDITKPMYLNINTDESNDELINVLSAYMI